MASITIEELRGLVKPDRVHRRVYTDPAIFALEMDRIFGRAWLYVAHESQLRNHGDFARARMGRHEVVVTRHPDGGLFALLNRCAHRGARFCMAPRGNSRSFTCPYHGWSYGPDGALEGVPYRQSYPASFRLEDPANHLARAPRVASYRGFVFASLAADGPSLREHLGSMTDAFDNLIDRAPAGEIELSDNSFQWEYRGNWKIHHENANDVFHPGFVHESSVSVAGNSPVASAAYDDGQTREMLRANGFSRREWENVELIGFDAGHSYMSGFYRAGIIAPHSDDPVRARYRAALAARCGEARAEEIILLDRFNNIIYPNLVVNAQFHQLRVVHPVAADRSIVAAHCFKLKGAPDEIFHRAVRFLNTISSPASMVFTDDVEIFARCQAGLADDADDWVDMARGLDTDRRDNDGRRTGHASELPNRSQFTAWLGYMTRAAA
ncbi:MAG TPA: Rieske 2Fe-2S domain-containing protein [Stellaceae bacterium]|nr:Rieske 2Fe-2S domain-containing protein [Stellaceae bacterium]